jgi:hypothetical protein
MWLFVGSLVGLNGGLDIPRIAGRAALPFSFSLLPK